PAVDDDGAVGGAVERVGDGPYGPVDKLDRVAFDAGAAFEDEAAARDRVAVAEVEDEAVVVVAAQDVERLDGGMGDGERAVAVDLRRRDGVGVDVDVAAVVERERVGARAA